MRFTDAHSWLPDGVFFWRGGERGDRMSESEHWLGRGMLMGERPINRLVDLLIGGGEEGEKAAGRPPTPTERPTGKPPRPRSDPPNQLTGQP